MQQLCPALLSCRCVSQGVLQPPALLWAWVCPDSSPAALGPSGSFCHVPAELQPYENLDNYCVIKETLLGEEDAGRKWSAKPVPMQGLERVERGSGDGMNFPCC